MPTSRTADASDYRGITRTCELSLAISLAYDYNKLVLRSFLTLTEAAGQHMPGVQRRVGGGASGGDGAGGRMLETEVHKSIDGSEINMRALLSASTSYPVMSISPTSPCISAAAGTAVLRVLTPRLLRPPRTSESTVSHHCTTSKGCRKNMLSRGSSNRQRNKKP